MISISELRETARLIDGEYIVVVETSAVDAWQEAVEIWASKCAALDAEAPWPDAPPFPDLGRYTATVIVDGLRAAADAAEIVEAFA